MAQKKNSKTQVRMSSGERRQMIIFEAGNLFAKKGFHGVTTKEIAKACGVSEPILYQHFKTKEELYSELHSLCKGATTLAKRALNPRDNSTETLCFFAYLLVSIISLCKIPGTAKPSEDAANLVRLTGYSFLEDGRFLKVVIRDCIGSLFENWRSYYKAALHHRDLHFSSVDDRDLWVAYELMVGTAVFQLTGPQTLPELHKDEKDYLERVSLFILRGLGVKENALKKNFKPKKWIAELKSLELSQ